MVEKSNSLNGQIYFVSVGRVRDQTMLATVKTVTSWPISGT